MNNISIFSNNELTMTSLEISELVNSNHPDVRRSIERLAERGIIQHAPTAKVENFQSVSPNNKTSVYVLSGNHSHKEARRRVGN